MKKTLPILVGALGVVLGLAACGGPAPETSSASSSIAGGSSDTSSVGTSSAPDTGESSDVSSDPVVSKAPLTVTYEGELVVGGDLTLIAKNAEGEEIKDLVIEAIEGADKVSILMRFVQLLAPGKVTLKLYNEQYEGEVSFEIQEATEQFYSITQIKKMVGMLQNEMIATEGIVTASIGNSFYLSDGSAGIYVYNMNSTFVGGDAFETGIIPVGKKVRVHGKLTNDSYGIQLNGYDGQYLSEAYVKNAPNADVEEPVANVIDTEEKLKELMKDSSHAGERITITGQYISGDLSALYNDKNALINMKLGNTEFTLKADRYDINSSAVKKIWNAANVEAGDVLTVTSSFTYYKGEQITVALAGMGTSVNNDSKDETKLRVEAPEKFLQVGKQMALTAHVPAGVEDPVSYEIIEGTEFATLEGNVLKGVAPGTIRVVAKAGALTSYPLAIQIIETEKQTIANVLQLQDGEDVDITAQITAITDTGFIVSDESGSIYVHDGRSAIYDEPEFNGGLGKTARITGTVATFEKNGHKQITNYQMSEVSAEATEYVVDFNATKLSDLPSMSAEQLNFLIPVHVVGTPEMIDMWSGPLLIHTDELPDNPLMGLATTMWQGFSSTVNTNGFIAGTTTYEGVTEYYFYFQNAMTADQSAQ